MQLVNISRFPSPYGVSFILIKKGVILYTTDYPKSFRLLTEYHSFLFINKQNVLQVVEDKPVSVSLRSIIHSYLGGKFYAKI